MIDPRSIIAAFTLLDASRFNLSTSGVLGLFGGDEAISAMATVHIHKGRRWLGWYNSPGSYQIAKRYGLVATSKIFRGLFSGERTDPAKLFGFDGWQGPRFQAIHSGTIMNSTGHLASVLVKRCATQKIEDEFSRRDGPGNTVSIVTLHEVPRKEIRIEPLPCNYPFLTAIIPTIASFATCIASGVYKDWVAFCLILWGMLANGISCCVIGSGSLRFTHHIPATGSPRGDGILDSRKQFVLLRGEEGAVNCITLGELSLNFPGNFGDKYIGYCSVLHLIQSVIQLLFIPQASLFGQIMFLSSLAVSWVYNSWLSLNKEEIQQHILWEKVLQTPTSKSYTCTTRTSAVVFALCVLSPKKPENFLRTYLPSDTMVWRQWHEVLLRRLQEKQALHFKSTDWNLEGYSDADRKLLETLYRDAQEAYNFCQSLPTLSSR